MLAIVGRILAVSIDIDFLTRSFFYFDEPVDFKLDNNNIIKIYPISLRQSEYFLSSIELFSIDKNSLPDASIIQMSYLQFIIDVLISQEKFYQEFINLLVLCLKMKEPKIIRNSFNKPILVEGNNEYSITGPQFEDIRRIILYQNLINFDDQYINPELKKSFDEMDELKNKNIVYPNLERRIAIITAHTGISKKDQLEMTYRSHSLLFQEVCGEIEFTTIRPIALFSGEGEKLDHWIFKKKKNKMEDYITQVDKYAKSMGSNQNAIHSLSSSNKGEEYINIFNKFNK